MTTTEGDDGFSNADSTPVEASPALFMARGEFDGHTDIGHQGAALPGESPA